MEEIPVKQVPKQLAPFIWKKGFCPNPAGRPKGKSLKEFARQYLESLPDDEKVDYLAELPPDLVWKMAEGNPKQDTELGGQVKMINITVPPEVAKAYNINATNTETVGGNSQQGTV